MILFIAVPVEDEEDFEYLAACSDRLKRHSVSGRFVRMANFHVTLVYIGETKRLEEAASIMEEAFSGHAPFDFVIDQTGSFSRGKSATVWVGGRSTRLAAMHDTLKARLVGEGFALEERKYRPHITLARQVVFGTRNGRETGRGGEEGHRSRGRHAEQRKSAFENPPHVLPVRRVVLFSSEMVDGKRIYSEMHSVDLCG